MNSEHVVPRCSNRNARDLWQVLSQAKTRILELVWSPTATHGLKFAAIKFMQRAILVQTRGISDPRVRSLMCMPCTERLFFYK